MKPIKIFGDPISGNCLKVKWTLDHIGLDYEWVTLGILKGDTRTEEFLKKNPFGQVPTVVLENDNVLVQSNAIIVSIAEREGSELLPVEFSQRSQVYQWLFWEQNSHEPYVAGRRFRKAYLGKQDDEIDQEWLPRGNAALALMDGVISDQSFLVGDSLTLADISLVAYTRLADEGGFDLSQFPNVIDWIGRVEDVLNIKATG